MKLKFNKQQLCEKFFYQANKLIKQFKYPEAKKILLQAFKLFPDNTSINYNLGNLCFLQNDFVESIAYFKNCLKKVPNDTDAAIGLFKSLYQISQDDAVIFFEAFLKLYPCDKIYKILGLHYADNGYYDVSKFLLNEALKLNNNFENKLLSVTGIPPMIISLDDEKKTMQDYDDGLNELLDYKIHPESNMLERFNSTFFIAYYRINPKVFQKKLHDIYRKYYPHLTYTSKNIAHWQPKKSGAKIKVGFYSAFLSLSNHAVSRVFRKLITNLPTDKFDIVIFDVSDFSQQNKYVPLENCTNIKLSKDSSAIDVIEKQNLDILVYSDIGMENSSYFMAYRRLAPIQCVLPGHPITTGIDTIDYYISSVDYEREDSDDFFTEKVVRMQNLPSIYEKPKFELIHTKIEDFNLPKDKNIYFCTGLLHKVSPHMDQAFARIFSLDKDAILVFASGHQDQIQFLNNRLKNTLSRDIEKVMVMPFMPNQVFYNFLKLVHCPLDTFFFAGGNTAFQCIGLDCPIVTLPDKASYSRGTYSIYAKMGIYDCVAKSIDDYAQIAVKLANDRNFYESVSQKIRQKNSIIFDNYNPSSDLANFFINAVRDYSDSLIK